MVGDLLRRGCDPWSWSRGGWLAVHIASTYRSGASGAAICRALVAEMRARHPEFGIPGPQTGARHFKARSLKKNDARHATGVIDCSCINI